MHVLFVPRAEALADPDLIRTKVNMIPESVDPICSIDIVGIDKQADGGTHVRCTGEVVRDNVVKTESKGRRTSGCGSSWTPSERGQGPGRRSLGAGLA